MLLDHKSLFRIVEGAAFLGSGGGGSIDAGKTFADAIVKSNKQPELVSAFEARNKLACIVCDIGSISAFDKNQKKALDLAFTALREHFESRLGYIQAIFSIETGPENTLAALVVGAFYGIPVIDGDGAGRAVPTLPLCTFSSLGEIENWRPVAIANGKGDFMLVNSHDVNEFESILRSITNTGVFDKSASLALWPGKVSALARKCVPGTISRSLYLGQLLEGISEDNQELIEESLPGVNTLQAFLIGAGEIIDTQTEKDQEAFHFSVVKMKNILSNDILTVIGQNENLIVFSDAVSAPVAIAPDSICYLTQDFKPLTNVEVGKAHRIFLIGVKAHPKLRHPGLISGFKKILLELGFAGDIKIKRRKYEPLGDLIIRLAKQHKTTLAPGK